VEESVMRKHVLSLLTACTLVFASLSSISLAAEAQPSKPNAAAERGRVNLNTASAAELESLPGIGPALAQRIVEYRQKNGPFKRIEDLLSVQGVGPKMLEKLHTKLTIDSAAR
jgi:competence protein ComEA